MEHRHASRSTTLALVAAIVALLAAGSLTRVGVDPGATPAMHRSIAGAAAHGASDLPPEAANASARRAPALVPTRPPAGTPFDSTRISASMIPHRYEAASDYRALFDDLMRSGEAEGKFFAAKMLVDCLDVGDDGLDAVLGRFIATVPPDSPIAAARIAAFRRMKEPCAGFSGRKPSGDEIERLVVDGARSGDLRALSQLLVTDRLDPGVDANATITRLLDSGDPYALNNFATYLFAANRLPVVIDGARIDPVDLDAAQFAWDLVSCDHGWPCGPTGKPVLHMCAHDGLCGAQTFEDLVRTEFGILAAFDRVQYFRERILVALAARDYASLGIPAADRK